MSTFGPIFSFSFVEQWILAVAENWFIEYLAEAERQLNESPQTFTPLADWGTANDFDKWPEEHLPFFLVMYAGLAEQPKKDGSGLWRARAVFGTSIIVSSNTRSNSRYLAHVYGAAMKACLLQHRSLEHPEHIEGLTWLDESPAPLSPDADRTLAAMRMNFIVDIKDIIDESGVPTYHPEVNPNPYGPSRDLDTVLPEDEGSPTPRGGVNISITQKEI